MHAPVPDLIRRLLCFNQRRLAVTIKPDLCVARVHATLLSWFPADSMLTAATPIQVNVLRGEQTYSLSAAGYTMLAESHLYHAQYPVLDFNTSRPGELSPVIAFVLHKDELLLANRSWHLDISSKLLSSTCVSSHYETA